MSEQVRESLSVLMDGEASELDLERALKHVDKPEVREAWVRYNAASRAVREPGAMHLDIDISSRVMAALESEPGAESIKPVGRWKNFLKPAASLAVAASFFSAVMVGGQFYGLPGAPGSDTSEATLAGGVSTVGMVNTLGGSAVRAGYATPALRPTTAPARVDYNQLARQRLQRYMLNHTEEAALNVQQGMMPFARVASFQEVED